MSHPKNESLPPFSGRQTKQKNDHFFRLRSTLIAPFHLKFWAPKKEAKKKKTLFDLYALPKARFEVNIASRTRKRLIQVYEKLLLRSRRALSQKNLMPPPNGGEEKENTLTVISATSEREVEFTEDELLGVFDKMLKDILNVMLDSLFRFRSTERYEKLLKKIIADSAKKE